MSEIHSIEFSNSKNTSLSYNTFRDFCLVPLSRPLINPPTPKTHLIDVPGANGSLDFTEALTSFPTYENREGSIEFAVLNDRAKWLDISWSDLYSKIANAIHGRKLRAVLTDDPDWYYEGRWSLSSWNSNSDGTWSTVTLDYNLEPYKIRGQSSSITCTSSSTSWALASTITKEQVGAAPVSPSITTSAANIGVRITNSQLGYQYERTFTNAGTYDDPALIFYTGLGRNFSVYLKGNGSVTFSFEERSL